MTTSASLQSTQPPVLKRRSPMMIVIVGGLVFGGAAMGAYYFLVVKPKAAAANPDPLTEKKPEEKPAGNKSKIRIVKLKPMVANLKHSKGTRFMKVSIALEASSEEVAKELESLDTPLADRLLEKISTVEISDVDTSEGRNKLKREMLQDINDLLEKGVVNQVFFTEFVIQ